MWTLDQTVAALGAPLSRCVLDDWSGRKLVIGRWRHRDVKNIRSGEDAIRIAMSLGGGYSVRYAQAGFAAQIDCVPGDIRVYPMVESSETVVHGDSDVLLIFIAAGALGWPAGGRPAAEPLLNPPSEDLRACALTLFMAARSRGQTRSRRAAATLRTTLLQLLAGRERSAGAFRKGGLQPVVLLRVDALIDARLNAPDISHPSVGDLATEARLSITHFIRAFRRSTGTTPHQYAMAKRRQRALALLRHPHLSVGEIADTLGFSSPAHFVASFRRRFGSTPGEYRLAVHDPGFTGCRSPI